MVVPLGGSKVQGEEGRVAGVAGVTGGSGYLPTDMKMFEYFNNWRGCSGVFWLNFSLATLLNPLSVDSEPATRSLEALLVRDLITSHSLGY